MLIRFGFGQLYVGRGSDWFFDYDSCVVLYVGPRGLVPPQELPWHRIWSFAWNWLPDRLYRTINEPPLVSFVEPQNSARWTGRDRKFIGFGAWRHQLTVHRTTWRSKMYVYVTGQKERANPSHMMWVCPGKSLPKNEVPFEWKSEGSDEPLTFAVEFKHGKAEVDSRLGEWMIQAGLAQRTNLIRPTKALLGSLAARIAGR